MDPRDFIRGFFGIPRHHPSRFDPTCNSDGEDEFDSRDNPSQQSPNFNGSFRVFTNPAEMEGFFNQQLDEMLKQFGFFRGDGEGHGFPSPGFFHRGGPNDLPFGPGDPQERNAGTRDFMLKKDEHPGYAKPEQFSQNRRDVELEQIPENFDKMYTPQGGNQPKFGSNMQTFSFGQTFSSSSVMLPDGSVEQHRVVKDNEGRETTTVTKKNGEDCITVTTIKHPDGKEERHESNSCAELNDFSMTIRQLPRQDDDSIIEEIFGFRK